MRRVALVLLADVFFIGTMFAQEVPPVSFNIGAGFTAPVGNTARHVDTGWNLQGVVGYNFIPRLGAMLELNYSDMGINRQTLNAFNVPGGSVRMWSLTVNPIVRLNPKGPVDWYFIGGGGLYHRTQEITEPAVGVFTGFDPFFGFYPVAVPVENVLASRSVMKPGVNIGAGFTVGSRWKGKFYAEARYHRMLFRDTHTDAVPVNFGYRW